MFGRALRWKPRPISPRLSPLRRPTQQRFQSSQADTGARFDRMLNRLPRFLRPYTESLRNAPVSNVVAFLILHEITAIVPLAVLAGWFHWSGWTPPFLGEGSYVAEGVSKFGRYFTRKGWFGFGNEAITGSSDIQEAAGDARNQTTAEEIQEVERAWHVGENGSRILIEVATAYAITKILLPLRIIFSVWATPWTARVFASRVFGTAMKSRAAGKAVSTKKCVGGKETNAP